MPSDNNVDQNRKMVVIQVDVAKLLTEQANDRKEISRLILRVDGLEAERANAFRWGVGILGSAVLTLAGYIWHTAIK